MLMIFGSVVSLGSATVGFVMTGFFTGTVARRVRFFLRDCASTCTTARLTTTASKTKSGRSLDRVNDGSSPTWRLTHIWWASQLHSLQPTFKIRQSGSRFQAGLRLISLTDPQFRRFNAVMRCHGLAWKGRQPKALHDRAGWLFRKPRRETGTERCGDGVTRRRGDTAMCILLSPYLRVSPSPRLPISPSPHLPISLSPRLRVSPSPRLPISLSPLLFFTSGGQQLHRARS